MNELYYNAEGFYDPTMGAALTKIYKESRVKLSPLGVLILTADAEAWQPAYVRALGFEPMVLNDDLCEKDFLLDGEEKMEACREIWIFGDYISKTMKILIQKAREDGIPVKKAR